MTNKPVSRLELLVYEEKEKEHTSEGALVNVPETMLPIYGFQRITEHKTSIEGKLYDFYRGNDCNLFLGDLEDYARGKYRRIFVEGTRENIRKAVKGFPHRFVYLTGMDGMDNKSEIAEYLLHMGEDPHKAQKFAGLAINEAKTGHWFADVFLYGLDRLGLSWFIHAKEDERKPTDDSLKATHTFFEFLRLRCHPRSVEIYSSGLLRKTIGADYQNAHVKSFGSGEHERLLIIYNKHD